MHLDACPVCKTTLTGEPATCPNCGSDLSVYRDLGHRAHELIATAREWLARGRSDLAHEVVRRLPQLVSDLGPDYHSLAARVALAEGAVGEARAHLAQLPADEREALASVIDGDNGLLQTAREEYNYALSAARAGRLEVAARHLQRATILAPADAQVLQLKLKVDVKRGDWPAVYAGLATLERLGARPEWADGLEALLPPLASAA